MCRHTYRGCKRDNTEMVRKDRQVLREAGSRQRTCFLPTGLFSALSCPCLPTCAMPSPAHSSECSEP